MVFLEIPIVSLGTVFAETVTNYTSAGIVTYKLKVVSYTVYLHSNEHYEISSYMYDMNYMIYKCILKCIKAVVTSRNVYMTVSTHKHTHTCEHSQTHKRKIKFAAAIFMVMSTQYLAHTNTLSWCMHWACPQPLTQLVWNLLPWITLIQLGMGTG